MTVIDYIKYTVDGKTYQLIDNGDGTWSKELNAPNVAGRYDLLLEVGSNGIVTYIDSSDSRYNFYLDVVVSAERVVYLEELVPDFVANIREFSIIYDIENKQLDKVFAEIKKIKSDVFITTSSSEALARRESFSGFKGLGTVGQRRSYLISLLQKGHELNEQIIREKVSTITGSQCDIVFYGSDELDNPNFGYSFLRVRVFSPDSSIDYRYEDIERSIKPLVPAHIQLEVSKYFSTWADTLNNYESWDAIYNNAINWQVLYDYLPI